MPRASLTLSGSELHMELRLHNGQLQARGWTMLSDGRTGAPCSGWQDVSGLLSLGKEHERVIVAACDEEKCDA